MLLLADRVKHVSATWHEGKVVVVAVAERATGGAELRYGVRRDGFEKDSDAVRGDWNTLLPLPLPAEEADQSVVRREAEEFVTDDGSEVLLRSVYHSVALTALARVELVSAFGYLYVFRSSTAGRALVDRFVLNGGTNKLHRPLELRYRRSGQRHQASDATEEFDSLATRSIDGSPFFEPTLELGFLGDVSRTGFAAGIVKAVGCHRWHFAAATSRNDYTLVSVRASESGGFELQDRDEPAIGRVTVPVDAADGRPALSVYDVHRPHGTGVDAPLLRSETRLMVSLPLPGGELGILDTGLATDGTVAQVGRRDVGSLKGTIVTVDLPSTSVLDASPLLQLESRRAEALVSLAARGEGNVLVRAGGAPSRVGVGEQIELDTTVDDDVVGLIRHIVVGTVAATRPAPGEDATHVELASALDEDVPAGTRLSIAAPGARPVVLSTASEAAAGTQGVVVEGRASDVSSGSIVTLADVVRFDAADSGDELGSFHPAGPGVVIEPGQIAGYEVVDGALRVQVPGHRLVDGVRATIETDGTSLDGRHVVVDVEGDDLVISAEWPRRRVVQPAATAEPRNCITMLEGGGQIVVTMPLPAVGLTFEAWIRPHHRSARVAVATERTSDGRDPTSPWELRLVEGRLVAWHGWVGSATGDVDVCDGAWHHVAFAFDGAHGRLFVDGRLDAHVDGAGLDAVTEPAPAVPGRLVVGRSAAEDEGDVTDLYVGDVADVRLWDHARSIEQVAVARDLPLTGFEQGLLGSWPCEGLSGEARRTVVDLAAGANSGTAEGDCHDGVALLLVALPDGTEIAAYRNDHPVPITPGLWYEESFEYRQDSSSGSPVFELAFWGRRENGEWVPIDESNGEVLRIEPATTLADGWRRTTAKFRIGPDSHIAEIRAFGAIPRDGAIPSPSPGSGVAVRNHRMSCVASTISEVRSTVTLSPAQHAVTTSSAWDLFDLGRAEIAEATLTRYIAHLDDTIRRSRSTDPGVLGTQLRRAERRYQAELADPLNTEGAIKLTSHFKLAQAHELRVAIDESDTPTLVAAPPNAGPASGERVTGDWYLEQRATNAGEPHVVRMVAKSRGKRFAVYVAGTSRPRVDVSVDAASGQPSPSQWWIADVGAEAGVHSTVFRPEALAGARFLRIASPTEIELDTFRSDNPSHVAQWTVQLAAPRSESTEYNAVGSTRVAQALAERDELQQQLTAVNDKAAATAALTRARADIASLRGRLAREADTSWQASHRDDRGLAMRTATLRPAFAGPMCLRTDATGTVELAASDVLGRIRTLTYGSVQAVDAPPFERWTSVVPPRCGELRGADARIDVSDDPISFEHLADSDGLLTPGITIELWYFHAPAVRLPRVTGLVSAGSAELLVLREEETGIFLSSFEDAHGPRWRSASLESLTPGWHHLCVRHTRTDEHSTRDYFVDGRSVSKIVDGSPEMAMRAVEAIHSFGSAHGSAEVPVRLAEIRVWDEPLRDDQIETNAMVGLTGREPGLIAWYPLHDDGPAQLNRAHSRRGHHDATAAGTRAVPFTGLLGHPGRPVRRGLAPLTLPDDAVARATALEFWSRWPVSAAKPVLADVYGPVRQPEPDVATPRDGDWHHVAMTWTPSHDALRVSIDGHRVLELTGGAARSALPKEIRSVAAAVARIRLWNVADSDVEAFLGTAHRVPPTGASIIWEAVGADIPAGGLPPLARFDNRLPGDVLAPVACEQVVSTGPSSATLERCWFTVSPLGVDVRTGQRVEDLVSSWVGNMQFEPTLVGYIESPPPVPSENLINEPHDYVGASSVQLTATSEVERTWTQTDTFGVGYELSAYAGPALDADAKVVKAKSQLLVGGTVSGAAGTTAESTFGSSRSRVTLDRLELVGSVEREPRFPILGRRFVPKNVGYAVVESAVADVYMTRLARSGRMLSARVVGVDDATSTNTITFMVNPAYTMVGSLDGLTGSQPTSNRYFPRVVEMRRRYGSRYPASHFRTAEAAAIEARVANEELARQAYYQSFDVVPENAFASVDTVVLPALASDAQEVGQQAADLASDLSGRTLPSSQIEFGMSRWAARIEQARVKSQQRNIVNTYVWDADGGLHSQSEQFSSTIEQHLGSSKSFRLQVGLEGQGEFTVIAGAAFELGFWAAVEMSTTLTKTESTSRGFALDVDLSGVERSGVTDHHDRPLIPGELVDRYRFKSYYLDGVEDHFDHFFAEIVDQSWLASNDEEAIALRAAQGKRARPWRVFHRVDYVERPALLGLGIESAVSREQAPEDPEAGVDALGARIDAVHNEVIDLGRNVDAGSTREALAALGSSVEALGRRLDAIEGLLLRPTPAPSQPQQPSPTQDPRPDPNPTRPPQPTPTQETTASSPGGGPPPFDPVAGRWGLWPLAAHKAVLRQGATGDPVRYLQGVIYHKAGGSVAIDGVFGALTKGRVVDVQRFFKIAADGVVGDETWRVIDLLARS